MNTMLSDFLDCFVLVYLDSILIYSTSNEKHECHLWCVFDCLHKHVLYAKLSKCELGMWEVDFLGHIVGDGQVRANPTKISAVKDWPVPTSVKHISGKSCPLLLSLRMLFLSSLALSARRASRASVEVGLGWYAEILCTIGRPSMQNGLCSVLSSSVKVWTPRESRSHEPGKRSGHVYLG